MLKPSLELPAGPAVVPKCSVQLQQQKWAPQDTHSWPQCDADHGLPFLSEAQCRRACAEPGVPFPEAAQPEQCCMMEVPWPGLEGSGSLFGEGSRHQLWCVTAVVPLTQAAESDPRRSSREVTQTSAVSCITDRDPARFLGLDNKSLNNAAWKIHEQKTSLYPGFQPAQSLTIL